MLKNHKPGFVSLYDVAQLTAFTVFGEGVDFGLVNGLRFCDIVVPPEQCLMASLLIKTR